MRSVLLLLCFGATLASMETKDTVERKKRRHHAHVGHKLRLPHFDHVQFSETAAKVTHTILPHTLYGKPASAASAADVGKVISLSDARFAAAAMRDANQQAQNVGTKKTAAQLTIELQEQLRAQSYAQSQTQARLSALAKMQSSVPGAASGAASLSYSNLRDEDRGSAAPARVLEESGSKMKFKSLSGVKHTMETAARHAATAHAKAQFGSLSGGEGESEHMPVDWPMKSKGKAINEQFVPWGKHIPRKPSVTYFVATGYQECNQCRRIIGSAYDFGKNYPDLCGESSSATYTPMCIAQVKVLQACPEFTNGWCYQDYGGSQALKSPCPDALICHYCLGMNPLHCVDSSFGAARGM